MTLLKEQDWLKIINEAYVHPYGHQLLCNYDWQTRLVVTKIFQVFQSGNYIAYTVLAECPVCKKTYVLWGGAGWTITMSDHPFDVTPEAPILVEVADLFPVLDVVKIFKQKSGALEHIINNAVSYLLYLYNPRLARKYLVGNSQLSLYSAFIYLDNISTTMNPEHSSILNVVKLLDRRVPTAHRQHTHVSFVNHIIEPPDFLRQLKVEYSEKTV